MEHRWSIAGAPLVHRWSGRGLAGVLAGELLAALVELLRREAQAHHVLAAHLHSPCALTRTSRLALSLTLALARAWNLVCCIWKSSYISPISPLHLPYISPGTWSAAYGRAP